MTDSETSLALPKFSGNKLDFPAFSQQVFSVAANATGLHEHGLLGMMLTAAAFDAIYPPAVGPPIVRVYRPILDPGPFNAAWIAAHPGIPANDQRAVWRDQVTDYRAILRIQSKFNLALIAALDDGTTQRISDPITGVANLDIEQLWTAIVNDRGTITPGDLREVDILTAAPFDPSDPHVTMRSHITLHRKSQLLYVAAGAPKSQYVCTEEFISTFRNLPAYADRLRTWMAMNPTVAGQTFAAVSLVMEQFEDATKRLPISTTASTYALTTTTSTAGPKAATKKGGGGRGISGRGGDQRSNPRGATALAYCWTHGFCYHNSSTCKFKAPGHVDTASSSNTHGGSTVIWSQTKQTVA
jgi:hypothetical protein